MSSLWGCLINKKTICSGIALAFERAMTEMNVENNLVCGCGGVDNPDDLKPIRNNHVWNRVKLYGKWYNVDVTNLLFLPNCQVSQEERVRTYVLSSDSSLKTVGNYITDYSGIPESSEDFTGVLEIYSSMDNIINVLEQYDQGNRSMILMYRQSDDTNGNLKSVSKEKKRDDSEILVKY